MSLKETMEYAAYLAAKNTDDDVFEIPEISFKKTKKSKVKEKRVIFQTHHISYDPPVTVIMYKGEHWIITQIQRRKKISPGFIVTLKMWIQSQEQIKDIKFNSHIPTSKDYKKQEEEPSIISNLEGGKK